jgi:hypothetical protein
MNEEPQLRVHAFATNVGAVSGDGMRIAPGFVLRRASIDETVGIKSFIKGFLGTAAEIGPPLPWESLPENDRVRPLPENEYRYFVVDQEEHTDLNGISDLQLASDISDCELHLAFERRAIEGGGVGTAWRNEHVFLEVAQLTLRGTPLIELTEADAAQVSENFVAIRKHDQNVLDLQTRLRDWTELRALPRTSRFHYLGCFTVLESLLTHAPRPDDRYDSITRQVIGKVNLLGNRMANRLPYDTHFGKMAPETVWKKLYAYRSLAAHGTPADFSAGDLAALGSADNALAFVRITAKALLRQALREPGLFRDLKAATI